MRQKIAAEELLDKATKDGAVRGIVLRPATIYGCAPLTGATGRGVVEPRDATGQRRLAATGLPYETERLSASHVEVDAVYRPYLVPTRSEPPSGRDREALDEVLEADEHVGLVLHGTNRRSHAYCAAPTVFLWRPTRSSGSQQADTCPLSASTFRSGGASFVQRSIT